VSLSKGRVSELKDGVGNDLKHQLRSSNEVYDAYWTAMDGTAGVTRIAQTAVSV
jgi:hypothetical protein